MNGILVPQHIFVGDTAQFFFPLSEQEYSELVRQNSAADVPLSLEALQQNDLMNVKELRIVRRDNRAYLHITFVPWECGEIDFPSCAFLNLKRKLPSIHVSSLIENNEQISLQMPKPPLLLPGTDYLLYGAVVSSAGCLVIVGTCIWLLVRKLGRRRIHTARKRMTVLRKRLKQLHKDARKIQKQIQKERTGMDIPDKNERDGGASAADTATQSQSRAYRADFGTQTAANTQDPVQQKLIGIVRDWYATADRDLREYVQALCAENDTAAHHEHYFMSATYSELTDTVACLFRPNRNPLDLFRIFYSMLEKLRFGTGDSYLLKDYAAVSQDILKKIAYIAKKTEAEYAAALQSKQEAAALVNPSSA